MFFTNFPLIHGDELLSYEYQPHLNGFMFCNQKKPLFEVGFTDKFILLESSNIKRNYGSWYVYNENGVMMKLGNGSLSFFSNNNLAHNILIYKIKKKKFGFVESKNKYCYVTHEVEIDGNVYIFIKFHVPEKIDFKVVNQKQEVVDTLQQYRKKQSVFSVKRKKLLFSV